MVKSQRMGYICWIIALVFLVQWTIFGSNNILVFCQNRWCSWPTLVWLASLKEMLASSGAAKSQTHEFRHLLRVAICWANTLYPADLQFFLANLWSPSAWLNFKRWFHMCCELIELKTNRETLFFPPIHCSYLFLKFWLFLLVGLDHMIRQQKISVHAWAWTQLKLFWDFGPQHLVFLVGLLFTYGPWKISL